MKRKALSVFLWGNRFTYAFTEAGTREKVIQHARVQEYLEEHPGMQFDEIPDSSVAEITIPFSADRQFRELLSEITGTSVYELATITKTAALALNPVDGSISSFFEVFEYLEKLNDHQNCS